MLDSASILDWPQWCQNGGTLDDYRVYVDCLLSDAYCLEWNVAAHRHQAQVPYTVLDSSPGTCIRHIRQLHLSTGAHFCLRSWCRLRCGLVVLRHLGGKTSLARYQRCIFCQRPVRNATVHVLGVCGHWGAFRQEYAAACSEGSIGSPQVFTRRVLCCLVPAQALEVACTWSAAIDRESFDYWTSQACRA